MSISTHAPLAGRDPRPRPRRGSTKISTHAPLAGRDRRGLHREEDNYYFNPRAPCGARQLGTEYRNKGQKKFQPTRPLRGATLAEDRVGHGESISTHAPLAGRDPRPRPRRGSTKISTHAPLAGRDRRGLHREEDNYYFNPRAPCGARQLGTEYRNKGQKKFQPTRPLRGATLAEDRVGHGESISTHAPLAGRDAQKKNAPTVARHFNPRAPCGARQQKCTNHYAHFCDNRQISDAFAQNAACQSILLLFDAGKPCGFGCEPPK